jgi:tetratricopeptide (TPR) repeat protein
MRTSFCPLPRVALPVALVLLAAPAARAGVYFASNDPRPWPVPASYAQFNSVLRELQSAVNPDATTATARRIRQEIARLEARAGEARLTVDDRVDLSACYLLTAKYDRALEVLTPAERAAPRHFLVLANLATVYHGLGLYERAVAYLEQALAAWPRLYPGWSGERLRWCRRAEQLYLTLLRARQREQALGRPLDTPDELFPGVTFGATGEKYAVGEMADRARQRLPADAPGLVKQLLLWTPQDNRLLWLWGELLNAHGEVIPASQVLDDLVGNRRAHNRALLDHRRALRDAAAVLNHLPVLRRELLLQFGPPFPPGPPPIARVTALAVEQASDETPSFQVPDTAPDTPAAKSWLPDWRPLAVGFGSGLVVGALLVLQLRQLFRRP